MASNLIQLMFVLFTVAILTTSLLFHLCHGYLSNISKQFILYGKYYDPKIDKRSWIIDVPKRWFAHFYMVAVPVTSIALILTVFRYFYNCEIPHFILYILDLLFGSSRMPVVSPESTITAIILLHIHVWKRLYESQYISIFSNAKMHLGHYAVGIIHYVAVTCCIIGESHGFVRGSTGEFHWSKLENVHFICSIIFLLASYEQLKTNMILANLRKDANGVIVTKSYKIPYSRLFEYISAPLQFTEVIMYLMLTIILWRSKSFHYVFIWVLTNQFETALLTHQWLHKTFTEYPKQRTIFIPFLI